MRWVIGDIHGAVRPLATLLLEVRRHDPESTFCFVGDYVNRGNDSASVLDLLIRLGEEGAGRFCRGNHDDVFDLLLNGRAFCDETAATDPLRVFDWFMQFGLGNTLASYGVEAAALSDCGRRPTMAKLSKLLSAVPAAHRRFIRSLEPVLDEGEFLVAHAKWELDAGNDPASIGELLERPDLRHGVLWNRFDAMEIAQPKWWGRPMFFGHTPVANYGRGLNRPLMGPSIALLDTGAALGPDGRLTAFCVEAGHYLQASHQGKCLTPQPVTVGASERP